ncbi:CBU_0592 family membrane protein [Phaeobacter marinintestinus]|uniref:CBU_0592 family membrane protein n=1 Tax=Falsiphaeobacter marinintestinus TaxID=1492905 RepID=UPI0011B76392|nr:hypothetical protein [Phaeobacter marinintestinus]
MFGFDFAPVDLEVFCRTLGLIGFAIYVLAFISLSFGRLTSTRPLYFVMVLVASSCVLASLWADFNLSAALIQSFYIVVSLGAIAVRSRVWLGSGLMIRK